MGWDDEIEDRGELCERCEHPLTTEQYGLCSDCRKAERAERDDPSNCRDCHNGYGFFPGGDPRDFSPDEESCTAEELEAHRLACEAKRSVASGSFHAPGLHVCASPFGLGGYLIRCKRHQRADGE